MKIVRVLLTSALFLLFLFFPQQANAANNEIRLIESTHRDIAGKFLNEDLSTVLSRNGRLGKLVFSPVSKPRIWIIDAALIDDVQAMPKESLVAKNWLSQLRAVTSQDEVMAIAYGHPNNSILKTLAPSELNYYYSASTARLEKILGRKVDINQSILWDNSDVASEVVDLYNLNRRAVALMSSVIPASELDPWRASLAKLLAPATTRDLSQILNSANMQLTYEENRLRIVPGKYRLTSQKENVPITLVNDFALPVKIQLNLLALNSRIRVGSVESITLAPNSKTQITIPVTIIAPGVTSILAQMVNPQGDAINSSVIFKLNVSVISPVVAWFTSGAAILLFLAALTQSVRRVRRSRK